MRAGNREHGCGACKKRERGRAKSISSANSLDQLGQVYLVFVMTKPVNIYDAKTHLSELVDRAEAGEEVIIARAGKPVARIVPLRVRERTPGRGAGKVWIAPDFDAPLSEDEMRDWEGDL